MTQIYTKVSVRANKALSDINNWFKLNKLSVNVKNCNFILFTTRPITADFKYHRLVSTSNSIRVYGVNVWNTICKHIRNIKSLKLFRTKYKNCIFQW